MLIIVTGLAVFLVVAIQSRLVYDREVSVTADCFLTSKAALERSESLKREGDYQPPDCHAKATHIQYGSVCVYTHNVIGEACQTVNRRVPCSLLLKPGSPLGADCVGAGIDLVPFKDESESRDNWRIFNTVVLVILSFVMCAVCVVLLGMAEQALGECVASLCRREGYDILE